MSNRGKLKTPPISPIYFRNLSDYNVKKPGKSKVYPTNDIREFLKLLNPRESYLEQNTTLLPIEMQSLFSSFALECYILNKHGISKDEPCEYSIVAHRSAKDPENKTKQKLFNGNFKSFVRQGNISSFEVWRLA